MLLQILQVHEWTASGMSWLKDFHRDLAVSPKQFVNQSLSDNSLNVHFH